MSRYSPTVLPQSGAHSAAGWGGLVGGLERYLEGKRMKRYEGIEDERLDREREVHTEDMLDRGEARRRGGLTEALTRAEAHDRGVRFGDIPSETRTVTRPEGFDGELGMQPRGGQHVSPLSKAMRGMGGAPMVEPRLVTPPGALMPGVGYTAEPVYDYDAPGGSFMEREPSGARMTGGLGMQRPETRTMQDPNMVPLGEGAYLDTRETGRAREEGELSEFQRLLAAEGIGPNRAGILARQPNLLRDELYPNASGSDRWYPTSMDESLEYERELAKIGEQYRPPTSSTTGRLSEQQAFQQLQAMYAIKDRLGNITGWHLSPPEMHQYARLMASGMEVQLPPIPQPQQPGGGASTPPAEINVPGFQGFMQRIAPFGQSGRMPNPATARPEEIDAWVDDQLRRGVSIEQLDDILRRAGWTGPGGGAGGPPDDDDGGY